MKTKTMTKPMINYTSQLYDKIFNVNELYHPLIFNKKNEYQVLDSLKYFTNIKIQRIYYIDDIYPLHNKIIDSFIIGYGFIKNIDLLFLNFFNSDEENISIFGLSSPLKYTNKLVIFNNISIINSHTSFADRTFHFKFKFYPPIN